MLETVVAGASSSGGSSFWPNLAGVIVGGVIVLVGQLVTAQASSKSAKAQRAAEGENAQREFRLEAVTRCSLAATELRAALAATIDSAVPGSAQSGQVSRAKSSFDVAVPRVHDAEIRELLRAWADKAITWANGELGAADEDAAWKHAMERLGEVERGLA